VKAVIQDSPILQLLNAEAALPNQDEPIRHLQELQLHQQLLIVKVTREVIPEAVCQEVQVPQVQVVHPFLVEVVLPDHQVLVHDLHQEVQAHQVAEEKGKLKILR
jgi:hypothetical protein